MKRSIATHEPHDYDTLEAAIFSAWQDLTQITIRHFIDHVTTDEGNYRCQQRTFN